MIKLEKLKEPAVLQENSASWTEELLRKLKNGEVIPEGLKRAYGKEEIKQKLREECFGKCMYCESKIGHITYEHVEHVKPKARNKYPELTFKWENLGLACPKCNRCKGDIYDEKIPFANPYVDEPANFFVACGPFIYHKAGNRRGEFTEKQIQLNRAELIEQRKERIDAIRSLADKCALEPNPELKKILLAELEEEIGRDKPYSACANSVFGGVLAG